MQEQPQFVISLDKMSPKMLVGECLDIAKVFLQELIQIYCGNNNYEFPIPNNSNDLLGFLNYMLDPSRYQKFTESFVNSKQSPFLKNFLRSWLHQLKTLRNAYSHWSNFEIDLRAASRAFDTLTLIYNAFGGHPEYHLFRKMETYRNVILEFIVAHNHSQNR